MNVLFARDNFWMPQKTMADLFGVKVPAVNKYLNNIYDSGELTHTATISKKDRGRLRAVQQRLPEQKPGDATLLPDRTKPAPLCDHRKDGGRIRL